MDANQVTEHTWGWNGGDIRRNAWTNDELATRLRTDTDFQTAVLTWVEQRSFIYNAQAALPKGSPLAVAVAAAFDNITAYGGAQFNANGFDDVSQPAAAQTCGDLSLTFGSDGSIASVSSSHNVVGGGSGGDADAALVGPFFKLWYQNLDHEDFVTFAHDYVAGPSQLDPEIIAENLVKPNYRLPSLNANATMTRLRTNNRDALLVDFAFPLGPHEQRGAPATAQALVQCDASGSVHFTLRWFNKTRTHAPETVWISHFPQGKLAMMMDKIGQPVDPLSSDLGCNGVRHACGAHLHGVGDGGVEVVNLDRTDKSFGSKFRLAAVDSALVSIGVANPLPTPMVKPDLAGGVHFALTGNM
jgi:hypothetical protein